MAKEKCVHCNEEMVETYTKVGLKVYLCPRTYAARLDKDQLYKGVAIYCEPKSD